MTSLGVVSSTATSKFWAAQLELTLLQLTNCHTQRNAMKVKPSVKQICEKCKVIRRNGRVMVICENPRHKQRQG